MKWLNRHPFLQSGKGETGNNEIHYFGSPAYHLVRYWWMAFKENDLRFLSSFHIALCYSQDYYCVDLVYLG